MISHFLKQEAACKINYLQIIRLSYTSGMNIANFPFYDMVVPIHGIQKKVMCTPKFIIILLIIIFYIMLPIHTEQLHRIVLGHGGIEIQI